MDNYPIFNKEYLNEIEKLELQSKLLKSFNLNYCCNMRIKTYKKLSEFIK